MKPTSIQTVRILWKVYITEQSQLVYKQSAPCLIPLFMASSDGAYQGHGVDHLAPGHRQASNRLSIHDTDAAQYT